MPYLGRPVTNAGQFEIIDDISSGFDGSETSFTLQVGGTDIQPDAANVTIVLDGVVQIPSSAYSVTGSTLNFSEAPTNGTEFHGVLAGQSQFIESGFITNTHISDSANISGSKINTDFSAQTVKAAIFDGMISGSAQLADDISGSFSQTHLSSKISGIVSASVLSSPSQGTIRLATNGVNTDVDSGLQTGDSPTFAGGTITGDFSVGGTLTAQEVHTEFESASIIFTSGSTIFGNSSDDVHNMTGSLNVSGAINLNNGDLIVTDNIGIGTDSPDSQLHVVAAGSPSIRVTDTTNTVTGKFQADNSVGKIGTHTNHNFQLFSDNTTVMTISGSGKVGIGTNSTVDTDILYVTDGASGYAGANRMVQLKRDTTNGNDTTSFCSMLFGNNSNGFTIGYGGTTDRFRFLDGGGAERVSILNGGNTGIGTNNPAYKLEVADATNPQIAVTDTTNTVTTMLRALDDQGYVGTQTNHPVKLVTNGTIRATLDTSGNVGIGVSPTLAKTQIQDGDLAIVANSADANSKSMLFYKSRNATDAGHTIVQDGDDLGIIKWVASDGGDWIRAAQILAEIDGTPGDDDMPGRIVFQTTPDGGITPVERMRIQSDGNVGIGTNNASFKLDITENAETNVVRFFNDGGDQNRDVMILQGGADAGPGNTRFITFNDGNGGAFGFIQGPANGATAGISFNTTADTSLLTLSGSRVGIGTNNPSTVLHNYIANGTYSNESTSHFINQAGNNRATIRNRSDTDNPTEIFFDINGAIRWCYSARETSDNTIRLFPQASSPSLTSVAGSVFTLTQGGNLTIGGSYSPFTGTHLTVPASGSSKLSSVQHWSSSLDDYVGKIVVSSGTFIDNKYQSGSIAKTIDEAWPQIELANAYKDKKVLGVVSGIEGNPFIENTPQNEFELRQNEHRFIGVNSLGEGCIWISNLSGSLENGDYITSSPIEGYGMKQDDDLLHNYTVAKISEDCDFSGNGHVTSSITHNGVTYKTAFVGCTYHCG